MSIPEPDSKPNSGLGALARAANGTTAELSLRSNEMKRRHLPFNAETKALLLNQFEAFRQKFGRYPVKGDPIFFDPDADTPTPIPDPTEARAHAELLRALEEIDAPPAVLYAFRKTRQLVTEESEKDLTPAEREAWDRAINEYEMLIQDESGSIELSFSLQASSPESPTSAADIFVSNRLSLMVREAYRQGISSHPLEGTFLNAWLSLLCMKFNISQGSTEAFRTCLGTDMHEIQSLLDKLADEFAGSVHGEKLHQRAARIEEARLLPASWFGQPPVTRSTTRRQISLAFELIQNVLSDCREADIPMHVVERMLFRYWLRTWVINNNRREAYFQELDQHLAEVLSHVNLYMKKYADPLRTVQ
jgi:hypothetical protein